MSDLILRCAECGSDYEVALSRIDCDCGGVLDLLFETPAYRSDTIGREAGLARFGELIPVDTSLLRRVSLGLSTTPLLAMGGPLFVKCDFISPSGSFKDRGAQVLTALALSLDAQRVVLDSSGNAGAAMAAHCARIGLACSVVVPSDAPTAKLHQSRLYGARVIAVDGGRAAATATARSMVDRAGTFYASHVENPFFLEGTKTWAFEVVEQLGDAPGEVVMSVGNGSLFLGAYRGFRYLYERGRTSRIPRMTAVQVRGWAPLSGDVEHGDASPVADGIAVTSPRRLAQISSILQVTGGAVRVVGSEEIARGTRELATRGIWVEPTSGAAWASILDAGFDPGVGPVAVSLGGAGFKSSAVPLTS